MDNGIDHKEGYYVTISFKGQVAAITGGGGDLGRAYALDLARRGAAVVVNDVYVSPGGIPAAEKVAAEVRAAGGSAIAVNESVGTPAGGMAIVEAAVEHFGSIDVVIHNAGYWHHGPFETMTPEVLDPVLDVHLRGAFFVTQPAWSIMKEKGYGRIVLTGSASGAFGREWGANYAAAKAGLLGLGRALALEGGRFGIKTNTLLPITHPHKPPSPTPTPPEVIEQITRSGIKGGLPPYATTDNVVPMMVWLASEGCSVNGEAFSVASGRHGRVFIGVTNGWLTPGPETPTAEEIPDHLEEIEDLGIFSVPGAMWEELRSIGVALAKRDGLEDLFEGSPPD